MTVPVAWVVSLMVALEPTAPWRPTFEKSAEAIARLASSEPLFDERGEERTAALLVSIAWYESRLKPTAKSSDGQYICLYQLDRRLVADPRRAGDDPEMCTRAALALLRTSLQKCSARPADERLAFFASGTCDKGLAESRYRAFLASKLLREHPFPPRTADTR